MRETKDQTISRLEREITALKDEIKLLKLELRTSRKNNRLGTVDTEKTHKDEIKKLQNEFSKMKDNWYTGRIELEKKLDEERNNCRHWESQIKGLEQSVRWVRKINRLGIFGYDEIDTNWIDMCCREDDKRLEYFNMGAYCDPYLFDFIEGINLILLINPHTGEHLSSEGKQKIYDLIGKNPYYLQKLKEIEPYLKMTENENSQDYFDAKQVIHDIGMDVYKTLYPDFPFDDYSV